MSIEKLQRCKKGCALRQLPEPYRSCAVGWHEFFCDRRRERYGWVAPWYRALAAGIAKRLAMRPFTSADGVRLHRAKGGYGVQRKLHAEGKQPWVARMAAQVSAANRAFRRKQAELKRYGMEPPRVGYGGLRGI